MLNPSRYNQNYSSEPETGWLEMLVMSNPHGVMRVLSRNGYTGYLAPINEDELTEAAFSFVHDKGDDAVIELLKEHPLYDVILGICQEEKQNFRNAEGIKGQVINTIRTINYKKLIEMVLILIGTAFLADKIFKTIFKE